MKVVLGEMGYRTKYLGRVARPFSVSAEHVRRMGREGFQEIARTSQQNIRKYSTSWTNSGIPSMITLKADTIHYLFATSDIQLCHIVM